MKGLLGVHDRLQSKGFFFPEFSRVAIRVGIVMVASIAVYPATAQQEDWRDAVLAELCQKYLGGTVCGADAKGAADSLLDQLAVILGGRLSTRGISGIPPQDLAALSLLVSSRSVDPAQEPAEDSGEVRPSPSPPPDPQEEVEPPQTAQRQTTRQDMRKGQEGFRQAVEKLADMPLSERMVITGDITAGTQAVSVSEASNLTSTFGRTRLNFVARAIPGSAGGRLKEGYFFMQMRAAGGPFDSSAVGGPPSFSALSDVATDSSLFNEGTSRGNLYLGNIYYQQEFDLGGNEAVGRFGVLDLSDYFDTNVFANNEARQFINGALVNSPAYKFGIAAPGFVGEYHRRMDRDWLRGAVVRIGYAVSRTERAFTSPIWSGELELQTVLQGHQGSWRVGGTLGNVADLGSVQGFHFSADQWISQNTGIFGRYAIANRGPGSQSLGPVRQSYSAGFQWRFADVRERVSEWAIGFSQTFGMPQDHPTNSERVLETYYRFQLTQQFSFTPDFQVVLGSAGRTQNGTHAILGLRLNFTF